VSRIIPSIQMLADEIHQVFIDAETMVSRDLVFEVARRVANAYHPDGAPPPDETKINGANVLTLADAMVNGARQEDYGHPYINCERVARGWRIILDRQFTISPQQVAMMLIWLKLARAINTPTDDTVCDIAGYAKVWQMIRDYEATHGAWKDVQP
jgi:hypothetical protein